MRWSARDQWFFLFSRRKKSTYSSWTGQLGLLRAFLWEGSTLISTWHPSPHHRVASTNYCAALLWLAVLKTFFCSPLLHFVFPLFRPLAFAPSFPNCAEVPKRSSELRLGTISLRKFTVSTLNWHILFSTMPCLWKLFFFKKLLW